MFYIEKDGRIVLHNEDSTILQNTLLCMPQYQGLEVQETDRPIENFQFADTPEYIAQRAALREEQFRKDFFQTSLGWIRRKVSMKTGEVKDFLTDLLPTIAVAQMLGRTANVITYSEPDFTQDIVNWESYQEVKVVTPTFITECANQTDTDFTGIMHALIGEETPTEEGNAFEEPVDEDDNIDEEPEVEGESEEE